jgi:cytoskeletal protein CcmA (bactofilin family)
MSVEPRPFLGEGAAFDGKVSFTGTLRIDGHLRGTARSTGTLVVGQPGLVEADLDVAVLIVHGSVTGAVRAQERIEVGATGKLEGDVVTPRLVVEDGGQLRAQLSMGAPQTAAQLPENEVRPT